MKKVLILILFLSACQINPPIELVEVGKPIQVFFCPRENCEESLISEIHKAKSSVHCAFFDLELEKLINSLKEKSKEVDVKVVVDGDNYEESIEGLPYVLDSSSQLSHNKFCIIDRKVVTTGSFNPTPNGNTKNNNNLVVIGSKFLADNFEEEFDELWNKKFGEGREVQKSVIEYNYQTIENYFCPEDKCAQRLIKEILDAKTSIHFMTFAFTDEKVADALLFSNVTIKGVFEKSQAAQRYSQYSRLKEFGLEVYVDANPKFMHHKVFIFDSETVLTGSYNPTNAGNKKNDENIIIIRDKKIAKKYLEEFEFINQGIQAPS